MNPLKQFELPQDPLMRAYLAYSAFIACLVIFLVVALLLPDFRSPMESLSAYYHGADWQRDLFVGTIFAVAVFLLLYKGGWQDTEAILLSVGGAAAVFVALFPTAVPEECGVKSGADGGLSVHGVAAGVLFASIFIVGVVLPWRKRKRKEQAPPAVGYGVSAGIMAAGAILAGAGIAERACSRFFLAGEALLVIGFGIFWLVRTLQLGNPSVRQSLQ